VTSPQPTPATLSTSDGHALAADVALPSPGVASTAAVVLCHPHPQYGGDRFNAVVTALFEALPGAGYAALRFDFRGEFGGGVDERLDVVAALDHLDSIEMLASVPRIVVGYSFGATVALTTSDARIAGLAAIAPPLAMMPATDPGLPTLVLTPLHDQFSPPESTEPIVTEWSDVEFDVVESADHFLAGHTTAVTKQVIAWLDRRFR
jgi:uncharacterized protein